MLQSGRREFQLVELLTFSEALLAGILLLGAAHRLWHGPRPPGGRPAPLYATALMGLVGIAALFFAAEEISWGQTFLGWDTPESYRSRSGETNLHNMDLLVSVQTLGSIFLGAVFFAIPLAWRKRDSLGLPPGLGPAIPPGPAVFTVAFAFCWKAWKNLYRVLYDGDVDTATVFYVQFLEQINEQKEMFCAQGLLFYGLACWNRTRPSGREDKQANK